MKVGLKRCTLEFREVNKYGFPFSAFIEVIGANGVNKTVETGWMFNPVKVERFKLVTAYVANPKKQLSGEANNLLIETNESDFYKKLLDKARCYAEEANKNFELQPMITRFNQIEYINMEGEFGYSYLLIKDNGFKKWLDNNDISRNEDSDCKLYVDINFNYQLSKNYTIHIKEVLDINGVMTELVSEYD